MSSFCSPQLHSSWERKPQLSPEGCLGSALETASPPHLPTLLRMEPKGWVEARRPAIVQGRTGCARDKATQGPHVGPVLPPDAGDTLEFPWRGCLEAATCMGGSPFTHCGAEESYRVGAHSPPGWQAPLGFLPPLPLLPS
ncbi:hypothetical protein mRhiFer1_009650 [Rhinolophus ferrumequinum]|uniref:Uncharacterized protein n=1 Tax=Rhinolophus ferrumequinum TaxID=59479 RepID=A0A7J7R614_RHIFE|nr:hypothetical protein mRhiFer1_009650 [Rhinolophus ferrumequinum]